MVRVGQYKSSTQNQPIESALEPPVVYLPLIQHIGKACLPLVKPGDKVNLGDKVASIQAQVFAPIHSPVSGKVVSIQYWPHPTLGRCKTIIIENDFKPAALKLIPGPRPEEEISQLTPAQVRDIILNSGIVGLGGASFPTHIKLSPPKPIDTLIINGAECEPYLTCDYRLMMEKTREIIQGIKLIQKCLGVRSTYIAIEESYPKAIGAFKTECSKTNIEIKVLKSSYPQGGEKQLIKSVLNKEVPRKSLPFDIGVVVQNIATVYAVYEAIYHNQPLYQRVITVSGPCLANPKNLLVKIGTPASELISLCGPLEKEPDKIIFGGPMMGTAQYSDKTPVIKSTSGIILLSKDLTASPAGRQEESCIRCGACVRECPIGLAPCLIDLASEKELWPKALDSGALDCVECGLCNFVCPSDRKLVQSIKRAKLEAK